MKYRKNEAKEYARTKLNGVWTALPTNFTDDDRLDEKGSAFNLDYCISKLKIAGHYCIGNVAEFWSMTNEERKRVHEINVETAKGRIPIIAGCHHQNPYEVVNLCQHAWDSGVDFAIILTPYVASNSDDAVYDFYKFVADRTDIGIVLFNIPTAYFPITEKLAKRLATIPNVCGFKQGGPSPAADDQYPRSRRQGRSRERRRRDAVALQHRRDGRPVAAEFLPAPLSGSRPPSHS